MPHRNSFLLCGDLNCSLKGDGVHVGTDLFTWQHHQHVGPLHRDMHCLHRILLTHDLIAFNTWNARHPPTYTNGLSASRIDHFLMRRYECDAFATDVKFFKVLFFAPDRGAACPHDVLNQENPLFQSTTANDFQLHLSTTTPA